jgi:hypothetical protein
MPACKGQWNHWYVVRIEISHRRLRQLRYFRLFRTTKKADGIFVKECALSEDRS